MKFLIIFMLILGTTGLTKELESKSSDLFEITDISWDSLGVSAFESFIYDNAMQVSISNFTSPGYKSGLRNGMNVLSVEKVEKRITKHWFYIPGLILYLLVFLNQKYNRKKDII